MIIYLGKIFSGEKQFAKLNKQKKFYPQNPLNSGVWPKRLFLFYNFGYFSQLIGHNINNINKITIRQLSSVAPLNCHVILIWTHVLCCQPLSRRVPTGIPHKAKVIRLIALVVGLVVEGGCSLLPIWLAGWDGVLGIVVLRASSWTLIRSELKYPITDYTKYFTQFR